MTRINATSANSLYYCIHSSHLFSHPLCEEQSLLKRIANVAFHILTLGIPLAMYHITSWYNSRIAPRQGNVQPYPALGQQALDFARKKLLKHPEIVPTKFAAPWIGDKTHQPRNPEIARLTTLYWDVAFKHFEELLKQQKINPWNNREVIEAADECMKIAYAISNLTLDDLKSFTDARSSQGDKRTYATALTQQDSYQYRTFYYCTNAYHWFRGESTWGTDSWNEEGILPSESISAAHASLFYQKGTIQNLWNQLYNNYCDRVRLYVDEKALQFQDNRHVSWTKKDTGIKSFTSEPDTQPT